MSKLYGREKKEEILRRLRRKDGEAPLATVSGVATTTYNMLRWADRNLTALSLLTTKSFQVKPNPGNREPVITEVGPGCFGNSVGLRNPGMETARRELAEFFPRRTLLNVSLSASCPEDFIILAKAFADSGDLLELNFSCPHAAEGYGSSIGASPEIAARYMEQIRDALGDDFPLPIFPKLTPNTEHIGDVASAVIAAGADGISAINTVGPELYIEKNSGMPILQNSTGGRGGKSGVWIRQIALDSVAAVRKAVGPDVPVIGMGGVSTGEDARNMINAGADIVGIGSALGKVHQRDWDDYTLAVRAEAQALLGGGAPDTAGVSSNYISRERSMEYKPYRVVSNTSHGEDIQVIELDGSLEHTVGRYVFIWIPGIGEKPYSIAKADPLSFLVKDRGKFSARLCSVLPDEVLYLRGPYGDEAPLTEKSHALLIVGGTGIAVVYELCRFLKDQGKSIDIWYGKTGYSAEAPMQDELEGFGNMKVVPDRGEAGRVIPEVFSSLDREDAQRCALYMVGPEPFMVRAAKCALDAGIEEKEIFMSMERISLCGIGLCGTCSCGGRLTCQYGTFLGLDWIRSNEPEGGI